MLKTFLMVAVWVGLSAAPIWATPPEPPKTVGDVYKMMLHAVSLYPINIKDLADHYPSLANDNIRINELSTSFDLPQVKDIWRGNINIMNIHMKDAHGSDLFYSFTCNRIGRPTLEHMRQVFRKIAEQSELGRGEEMRHLMQVTRDFANIPDEAVAMQVCNVQYPLPPENPELSTYEALLSAIGSDFIVTDKDRVIQTLRSDPSKVVGSFFRLRASCI